MCEAEWRGRDQVCVMLKSEREGPGVVRLKGVGGDQVCVRLKGEEGDQVCVRLKGYDCRSDARRFV